MDDTGTDHWQTLLTARNTCAIIGLSLSPANTGGKSRSVGRGIFVRQRTSLVIITGIFTSKRSQAPEKNKLQYLWGGLLTDRLESKHKKLARQIGTILGFTKPQRHIHTNIDITGLKHDRVAR